MTLALPEQTGYLLIKLGEVLLEQAEQALAPLGLRARQFNVLSMINDDPTLSQRAISGALGFDPTIMVTLIDDLEQKGLVQRERDPADRRRHRLRITATGQTTLHRAFIAINRAQEQMFMPLDVDEKTNLHALANRVLSPLWPGAQISL